MIKKIGVNLDGLDGWGGGIRLIELFIGGLEAAKNSSGEDVNVYVIKKNKIARKLGYIFRIFQRVILSRSYKPIINLITSAPSDSLQAIQQIKTVTPSVIFLDHIGLIQSWNYLVKKNEIDSIVLTGKPLKGLCKSWIGYIPDCQHKILPSLFSQEEIKARDRSFGEMLSTARNLICNGYQVRNDLFRYFGSISKIPNIHVLPFSPYLTKEQIVRSFSSDEKLLKKYDLIKNKYFIISNQFWAHKDHETAIIAFNKFYNSSCSTNNEWKLVCTGSPLDIRFPKYFDSLMLSINKLNISSKVILTGHIAREEQLKLMAMSAGLIQPTHFEGGPGGGAVYDAVALGLPCFVSDIPINMEINLGNIIYFECGNSEELSQALIKHINDRIFKIPSIGELIDNSFKVQLNLGNKLLEIINVSRE